MTTPETNNPIQPSSDRPWVLYLSSGFGALFLGISDLASHPNESEAATYRLGIIFSQLDIFDYDAAGLPLILLTILGIGMAWVYQPLTRVDAFTRGFALFAMMSVATPFEVSPGNPPNPANQENQASKENPNSPSTPSNTEPTEESHQGFDFFLGSEAYAQELGSPPRRELKTMGLWVSFKEGGGKQPSHTTIIVREAQSRKIIGRYIQDQNQSPMINLRQPKGSYIVEVEAPGYARTQSQINLEDDSIYHVELEKTFLPLFLQKIFPPVRSKIEKSTKP